MNGSFRYHYLSPKDLRDRCRLILSPSLEVANSASADGSPASRHSTRSLQNSRTKLFLVYHLRLSNEHHLQSPLARNHGRLCSTKRIPSSDTLEPQLSLILEAIRKFSLSLCPPSPLLPTIRINTITPPGPAINWPLWQLLSYWLYAAGCSDSCSPLFFISMTSIFLVINTTHPQTMQLQPFLAIALSAIHELSPVFRPSLLP